MGGKHSAARTRQTNWPAVAASSVAVASLTFAWWLAPPDNSTVDADQKQERVTITTASATIPTVDPTVEAKAECQTYLTRQIQVMLAADQTLDQWQLHIDAMNQLVAGTITLDQAVVFWKDTEDAAKQKIHAFMDLDADLHASGQSCPPAAPERCLDAADEWREAMLAAHPAAETWHHHIMDMNALMQGKITPEQAVAAWTATRAAGTRQLARYDTESAQARNSECA